jgi:uncharacterized RDD family membrane protein YckC
MSTAANPRVSTAPRTAPNPYAPPRARVHDVSVSSNKIVLAERSARLGAAFVDGLIMSALVYLPMLVGFALGGAAGSGNSSADGFVMIGLVLGLIGFVVFVVLTWRQMAQTGQSLAKKYFNIKVVMSDGSPASMGTLILKRNVLNGLLGIIPAYGFVELLFIFGEKRQCLHDRIADTIVVVA